MPRRAQDSTNIDTSYMFLNSVIHGTWGLSLYQNPPLGSRGLGSENHSVYTSMDTGAVKGIARRPQQCTNIGLSASFLCGPPMVLGPQFQPQVSLRFRVMIHVPSRDSGSGKGISRRGQHCANIAYFTYL